MTKNSSKWYMKNLIESNIIIFIDLNIKLKILKYYIERIFF